MTFHFKLKKRKGEYGASVNQVDKSVQESWVTGLKADQISLQ